MKAGPTRPQKHVPQRTCIACRRVEAKRGLVRVVRVDDNGVAVDPTGKRPGRGAYLCKERSCWSVALKRKAIERALNIGELRSDDRATLVAYHLTLPDATLEPEQVSVQPEDDAGDVIVVATEGRAISCS